MAQPSQPPSGHNLRNPNKTKAPIVVEPVDVQQEQREGVVETLTQTVTPEVQTPRGSFDPSAILRAGSISAQATMLKRLNAAQSHDAAAHIGNTQGNRHLSKVVSTIKSTPNKPQTSPAPSIQTKLTVSEPGDQYEEEADRVADQVMRMAAPPPPPAGEDEENKPGVHRSALGLPPLVQASADGAPAVTPDLEASIQRLRGTGHPLPGTERTFFEERLSVDLSNVRVHTGPDAVQTSRDLSARAYTRGSDIVFNEGQYQPGSSDGRQLLAHELTHVVQQGGAARLKRAPDGTIQRQEDTGAGGEEEGPSEADKAAAREAAAEAEAEAARAKATGETETAAAQGEAAVETQAAQAPQAEAATSQAKGPVDDSATQALEATAAQGAEATKEAAAQFAAGVASVSVGPAVPAMPGPAAAPAATLKGVGSAVGAPAQVPGKAGPGSGADPAGATQAAKSKVEGAFTQAESPPDKAPVSQAQDPAFQAVKGTAKSKGEEQKAHEPAKGKAAEAQAAAVSPPAETQSKAEANKVGTMEQTETPGFDAAGFKAALMQRIAELAPSSMEGADEFKERGGAAGVKDSMQGQLDETSQGTKGPLEEATSAEPDTGAVEPKEVTPLQPADPGAAPGAIGAERAVPKNKGQGEVETPLQESSQALDQQMADAEITEEQLEKSNEPEFTGALESKREAQASVAEAPGTYRQAEGELISSAEADAVATAQTQMQSMHDTRSSALTQVQSQQEQTKTEDEQKRAEVAEHIQGIYQETESKVNEILTNLDSEVNSEFDAGAEAARQVFENYVDRKMEAYKQDRYGGFWGWAKWVKDKLLGMPSEVNAFYAEGRNLYLSEMDAVIDTVVAIIGKRLAEAKAEIARGKQRIQEYVDGLPEDLQEVGQQAADEVQSRFDDLEQTVDAKQNELIDTLANKYQENLQALDARIEELKAANKGLVDHVLDAIGGVIKTILELKDMLLNVLARVAEVVMQIIKDPIGFLGNLIAGIKQGIQQFVSNIGTHLKKGFIAWLTGSLGEAGITLPEKFDLKGIFQLVMQVLGLSFDNIKQRVNNLLGFDLFGIIGKIIELVKIYREEGFAGLLKYGIAQLIGEDKLQLLMSVIDIFKALMSGDLGAVWEIIKQHLSTLKEMVIDQIKSFIIEKVIKAGITWIIGLLNPAGAFIKACKAIYDIVMFFIERGSQIMALVNAVIDSVAAIVSGNISAAANMVETALARAIPVAIGFLASLLGLGGISQKVQEIIKKVRGVVDRALDAVFNSGPVQTVAKFIKKIIGKIKNFGQSVVQGIKSFLFPEKTFTAGDETHKLWVKKGKPTVYMASDPKPVTAFLSEAESNPNIPAKNKGHIPVARTIVKQMDSLIAASAGKEDDTTSKKLLALEDDLASTIQKILAGVATDDFDERYKLEGMVGTYGNMADLQAADQMSPDHQPQAALIEHAAGLDIFGNTRLPQVAGGKHADGAWAINLHDNRHRAGRTYGGKGAGTAESAKAMMQSEMSKHSGDKQKQREAVIGVLKKELAADVSAMRGVVSRGKEDRVWRDLKGKDETIAQVRQQVLAGLGRLQGQNMDSWAVAQGKEDSEPELTGQAKIKLDQIKADQYIPDHVRQRYVDELYKELKEQSAGTDAWGVMKGIVAKDPTYLARGPTIPSNVLKSKGGMTRVVPLSTIWNDNLDSNYKKRFTDLSDWLDQVKEDPSIFNPNAHLNKASTIPGQYATAWWSPRSQQKGNTMAELIEELALNPSTYTGGCVRATLSPAASQAAGFKKPTALDGIFFAEYQPAPGRVWGVTAGGSLEAVAPRIPVSSVTSLEFLPG